MPKYCFELQAEEETELRRRERASTVAVRDRLRAQIVLLASQGLTQQAIAQTLCVSRVTVNLWCQRFAQARLNGLADAPGRGRKSSLPTDAVQKVLQTVAQPPQALGRWSCRSMARAAGISKASVQRLWAANDIKPHQSRTFKLSNDVRFVEKFWDVIGLYLNPPDKALVLCCDEKTQCQALQRTQPGLPLGIGHIKTQTHDYIRHGTVTLFAALNYMEGKLIASLAQKHRHQEWLSFLRQIERETPKDIDIHLIADNYATHKHAQVKAWLDKHPRFHMHFTPTSASWMNMVERFFRDITDRMSLSSFGSVRELSQMITDFIAVRNQNPKRYVWRADGQEILRKIERARQAMQAQSDPTAVAETM